MNKRLNDLHAPMQFNGGTATPVRVDWSAAPARRDPVVSSLDGDGQMPSGWYIIPMVTLGIACWAGLFVWLVL